MDISAIARFGKDSIAHGGALEPIPLQDYSFASILPLFEHFAESNDVEYSYGFIRIVADVIEDLFSSFSLEEVASLLRCLEKFLESEFNEVVSPIYASFIVRLYRSLSEWPDLVISLTNPEQITLLKVAVLSYLIPYMDEDVIGAKRESILDCIFSVHDVPQFIAFRILKSLPYVMENVRNEPRVWNVVFTVLKESSDDIEDVWDIMTAIHDEDYNFFSDEKPFMVNLDHDLSSISGAIRCIPFLNAKEMKKLIDCALEVAHTEQDIEILSSAAFSVKNDGIDGEIISTIKSYTNSDKFFSIFGGLIISNSKPDEATEFAEKFSEKLATSQSMADYKLLKAALKRCKLDRNFIRSLSSTSPLSIKAHKAILKNPSFDPHFVLPLLDVIRTNLPKYTNESLSLFTAISEENPSSLASFIQQVVNCTLGMIESKNPQSTVPIETLLAIENVSPDIFSKLGNRIQKALTQILRDESISSEIRAASLETLSALFPDGSFLPDALSLMNSPNLTEKSLLSIATALVMLSSQDNKSEEAGRLAAEFATRQTKAGLFNSLFEAAYCNSGHGGLVSLVLLDGTTFLRKVGLVDFEVTRTSVYGAISEYKGGVYKKRLLKLMRECKPSMVPLLLQALRSENEVIEICESRWKEVKDLSVLDCALCGSNFSTDLIEEFMNSSDDYEWDVDLATACIALFNRGMHDNTAAVKEALKRFPDGITCMSGHWLTEEVIKAGRCDNADVRLSVMCSIASFVTLSKAQQDSSSMHPDTLNELKRVMRTIAKESGANDAIKAHFQGMKSKLNKFNSLIK